MPVLKGTVPKRTFNFKRDGKTIDLPDFNPMLPPESVIKYYAGTYPELTSCKIEAPEVKGDDLHFNIGAPSPGTLG